MPVVLVRDLDSEDLGWVRGLLVEKWRSPKIARRGEICYADKLPGFVAVRDDRRIGLLTYHISNGECEIVTLNSLEERVGVGSLLIEAVKSAAIANKCHRIRVMTTNDNTAALRFYQKRGFVLVALYRNAIQYDRELKPEIPDVGLDGIPIRDEIELELIL
jgi:ribosomal protein S18 acetylase RimI-like enzyme